MVERRARIHAGRTFVVGVAASVVAFGAACSDVVGPLHAEDLPVKGIPGEPGPAAPPAANPLSGVAFFVDAFSNARLTADAWRATRPEDAAALDQVASAPQGRWFGGWNTDIEGDVARAVNGAASSNSIPVLVAYNIPQRDCGAYSAGGASSADGYRSWISAFARGLGARTALVVLEPDALAGLDCLNDTDRQTRTGLLSFAVRALRDAGALVYLDGGAGRRARGGRLLALRGAGDLARFRLRRACRRGGAANRGHAGLAGVLRLDGGHDLLSRGAGRELDRGGGRGLEIGAHGVVHRILAAARAAEERRCHDG